MGSKRELEAMVQKALRAATPSMRDLSEETGIGYGTLRAWSAGVRSPSPENARILAKVIARRSRKLANLCDELTN